MTSQYAFASAEALAALLLFFYCGAFWERERFTIALLLFVTGLLLLVWFALSMTEIGYWISYDQR